jgi:hypothetical protein
VQPPDDNQLPLIPASDLTLTETPVPAVEKTSGERPRPGASRFPLIAAGIAAAVGGIMMGVALVVARADKPGAAAEQPAAVAPAQPAPVVESPPTPAWTGARRPGWASDGSKTIAFTLASTRDLPVWMSRARPALIVRCLSRKTEAFVVLDTSASFEADADRRTVRIQWDDEPASVQQWAVSESGHELFAPDSIAFAQRMVTAQQLRFGFTPFNAQPVTAEFAVQGFDQLAGLVAKTCK